LLFMHAHRKFCANCILMRCRFAMCAQRYCSCLVYNLWISHC
jgi:hypothetical protein